LTRLVKVLTIIQVIHIRKNWRRLLVGMWKLMSTF